MEGLTMTEVIDPDGGAVPPEGARRRPGRPGKIQRLVDHRDRT
jgi:hypothetical protein